MALGEFEVIRRYFSTSTTRSDVLLGVGDDAAVLGVPADRRLVVTVDTIIEGVHFPANTSAEDIGYRALAVNLSDLAAMGAQPAWITLSLSIPRADEAWLQGFARGLFALATEYHVDLVGGDTVRGPLVITVQAMGLTAADHWLTRSGAHPGDAIYVSGIPGEAAAGLRVIQNSLPETAASRFLVQRFLRPSPRVALGQSLRGIASAAMDISDGLLIDLEKLCTASHCGARVELQSLPYSHSMHDTFDAAACELLALSGGDDYELLFTVPPHSEAGFLRLAIDTPCRRIGYVVSGSGVRCTRGGAQVTLETQGFDHFSGQ
jgi:thiamine-monophosphate kinase